MAAQLDATVDRIAPWRGCGVNPEEWDTRLVVVGVSRVALVRGAPERL